MPTTAVHPNDDGNVVRLTIPGHEPIVVLREQVADIVLIEVSDPTPTYRDTLGQLQTALDNHEDTTDLEQRLGLHLAPLMSPPVDHGGEATA